MTKVELQRQVMALPVAERLELVEDVWCNLAPDEIPVPAWQIELIDERLDHLERHPEVGESWEQVEKQIWSDTE